MIAAKLAEFLVQLAEKGSTDDAGMTVVLHYHHFLALADCVNLMTHDEPSFLYRMWRCAECNDGLGISLCCILSDHPCDLLVRFGLHHIQSCIECRKGCKVLMGINECRSKDSIPKSLDIKSLICFGQLVSNIDNLAVVFYEISVYSVVRINGENCSFVTFHNLSWF